MLKLYSGIGSRQTPEDALKLMEQIGEYLAKRGWVLRSGAAPGADAAFERGCDRVDGAKEIFLPWKNFQKHPSPLYFNGQPCAAMKEEAYKLAEKYHPAWNNVWGGATKLIARNGFQVLGFDLATPVVVVVCWTPYVWEPGVKAGGTAQALRIAHDRGIKILNLKKDEDRAEIETPMKTGLDFLEPMYNDIFEVQE